MANHAFEGCVSRCGGCSKHYRHILIGRIFEQNIPNSKMRIFDRLWRTLPQTLMTVWWNFTPHEAAAGPRFAAVNGQVLTARGIVADHVGDLGMAGATDNAILEAARQKQSVVVTLDADFHQLLAASRATSPSVVRIRIENLKGEALATILHQVVAAAHEELTAGAVVSVTPSRIRVRLLPVGH